MFIYLSHKVSIFFNSSSRKSKTLNLISVIKKKPPVFISYSRKDKKFLGELKTHLAVYERQGKIQFWDDTKIKSGSLWRIEIQHALKSAQVAILLVSNHYLASDFIVKNDLPPLLKSAKSRGTTIIPIIVSHCAYDVSELSDYGAFNPISQPLHDIKPSDRNLEYLKVLDEIKTLLNQD